MSTNLTAFNTQIFSLVDELIEIYPEDTDFKKFQNTMLMLKKANARAISDLFYEHIYKYKEMIVNKNESFFLENDFTSQAIGTSTEKFISIVTKLRQYWTSMSDNTKENIWKYFNVFIILCERCNNITVH